MKWIKSIMAAAAILPSAQAQAQYTTDAAGHTWGFADYKGTFATSNLWVGTVTLTNAILGPSGSASSSTYLRGDWSWSSIGVPQTLSLQFGTNSGVSYIVQYVLLTNANLVGPTTNGGLFYNTNGNIVVSNSVQNTTIGTNIALTNASSVTILGATGLTNLSASLYLDGALGFIDNSGNLTVNSLTSDAGNLTTDGAGDLNVHGYTQLQQGSYNSSVYWNGRGQVLSGNALYAPMWNTNYVILTNDTSGSSNIALIWIPTNGITDYEVKVLASVYSNSPSTPFYLDTVFDCTVLQGATNVYTLSGPDVRHNRTNINWQATLVSQSTNTAITFQNLTGATTNTIAVKVIYWLLSNLSH